MSRVQLIWVLLILLFTNLECEIYKDRPRIRTSDGDFFIEPAFDKSIHIRSNGPKSNIFIGGINFRELNFTDDNSGQKSSSNSDLERYLNGPNGILRRLEVLENRQVEQPNDLYLNISLLWRRVNRLTTRITNLQLKLNTESRDNCRSSPCQNGGTCLNLMNDYHCLCSSNWEGKDCDVDVNECRNFAGTDLGCQNGATCVNRQGTYECLCRPGWFGVHCTRKSKDCSGGNYEMCGHGTCVPVTTGEGIICLCDQGWTTNGTEVACLTDVNECESNQGPRCSINPKVECINLPGSFRCGDCPPGYEGDGYICSDIDECLSNEPNGGCSTSPMVTCHNTIGSRICGPCPPGYQGDGLTCTWRGSCSVNHGGCHPSARCVDNPSLGSQIAQCVCPDGMYGDGVGLQGCYVFANASQGCESNTCGIHGQCHPLRHGFTCICYRGYGGARCDAASNYCASNPCLNGGTCRLDESSAAGFRCECTAQYTGDLCHVMSRRCGGVLRSEEGSIVYPMTNTTYSHNSRCAWVIQTAPDKVINVTFTRFNLEPSSDCSNDFLQIHDGRTAASPHIGIFCGDELPHGGNIISSHNYLYFWFRSDQTIASYGFALHWTTINPVCGGGINATVHGHISSPGSPGKYPPNRDCYWRLTTTLGKRIQLHFFAFDIESHSNCSFDYLAIYDGQHDTDPLISRYCNSSLPAPVQSSGSELLIHFHSDAHGSGNGFQIAYAPSDGVPGCGGFFTTDVGEIVPPSYNGKYLSNLLCEYKIQTSPDTQIHIKFTTFKIERSTRCKYDYLKIYDGPSSESRLVGKFCGQTLPNPYTSSSNKLFIIFKSDHVTAFEGFRITYTTVCQKLITGDSGVVKSPGYPFSYPANRVCEYIISTVPGKAIQLTFQDFDIEDNRYYNCQYDNVEIRDGANINATLMGRFCGGAQHTPPIQRSTHNYMYIKFKSDISISGTGFYANYTTVDVECGGIYKDMTGLISHPPSGEASYKNGQSCTWILIAPEGMHIKLTWNRFDLEYSPSCRSDYLEMIEIDENNQSSSLGKFCNRNAPPAWITTTNILKLHFKSDFSITYNGFSLSYTFLDDKSHCGGTYFKTHGFIHSPGWPKRYQANRDCTWIIAAPKGQQIKLNISQFDLEVSMRGNCDNGDYLLIRNGGTESSPLIGKYCGSFPWKRVLSFSNSLYLHFHSDSYLGGNGFTIEWDSAVTGCGGKLTSPSGSIISPNYPSNYHDNAECFYKIVTSVGSKISIRFRDLELESSSSRTKCFDDFVEIYDGSDVDSPNLGRFCRLTQVSKNIETSSHIAFIKFRSDFYIGAKGFLLDYDTICQNNLTGIYGAIESPGYPDQYPPNLNCLWTIQVPKGNKINVTFTHFDVGSLRVRFPIRYGLVNRPSQVSSSICGGDYLRVTESSEATADKHCGSRIPSKITTIGNLLKIQFVTDMFTQRSGFRLEWARYGCGGYIQKKYGTISVDNTVTAAGDIECEWIIEGAPQSSITLSISELYMTESKNCTLDAVEIYNGPSVSDPLLTKFCHRVTSTIQSTTNLMLIRFVKRSNLKDVRFVSLYDSFSRGCGGRIQAVSGVIHSKNYPKNYDKNMDCMWTLEVPENHRIELNFVDFDLYKDSDANCGDFVKIYDGHFILNKNYSQIICADTQNISRVISKNNILGVQFISGNQGTAKGFKANFTVTCGAIITARYDGIITNEKFVSHLDTNCTWTILAPSLDQKISLTITHMAISKDNNIVTDRKCPSSYLRVYDGNDNKSPILEEYCGRKVPPMIVSRGSAITIELGAYAGMINGQFSAHYTAVDTACGGILTSEEGTIASPNYPMSYPENADCEWTLETSPGNRVYITFENFDLEYSENCNEDYLEIRENDGVGRLIDIYCGNEIPTNTTIASKLYIKFHSDNKETRRGFLMHYGFLHGNIIVGLKSGTISSPLYPNKYHGAGDFSWRIVANGTQAISVIVSDLEIPVHGSTCYNYLNIYDGYDDEAPLTQHLCGFLDGQKVLESSTDVVFIRLHLEDSNFGSSFFIRWAEADVNIDTADKNNKINCGSNSTQVVSPGQVVTFNTPDYPHFYGDDLNCEWIFESPPHYHLRLHLVDLRLEQTSRCFDYLSIYTSDSVGNWKPAAEKICLSSQVSTDFNATNFKIKFVSDSSVREKGFQAKIFSECGGTINELSGVFGPTLTDFSSLRGLYYATCEWIVKVRPGRVITFNFEHFNITNPEEKCGTYVTVRNGDSEQAPFLGIGKYCGYTHENKMANMETSSNALFVSYRVGPVTFRTGFKNFRIRYEEKSFECGTTSKLDADHAWEVITSPNYPSVPVPYSECVWIFTGPPGEALRIDFDRVDLMMDRDCTKESLEIRDGSTELAAVKKKICGNQKQSTIKTSGNSMYIKYLTLMSEPHSGFKANVSIESCGGTIVSNVGEITSPGYPHFVSLPAGTVCEWKIIGSRRKILFIDPKDINLPESVTSCGTKITIEETLASNNVLQTYCTNMDNKEPIETSSNAVIIKLHIGTTASYAASSNYRGFRFTFNTSLPTCGGTVTTPSGFLTTPGYPRETGARSCYWLINVPDKSRRVRVEILDSDLDKHNIYVFHDLNFHYILDSLSSSDSYNGSRVLESTGNTMGLYLYVTGHVTSHRFKAIFNSDQEARCGGSLNGPSGSIESPDLQSSYLCSWHYAPGSIENATDYNTLFLTVTVNSSVTSTCRYSDPKLFLKANVDKTFFVRNICGKTQVSYRIPSTEIDLRATKNKDTSFNFLLQWKLQPCGGIVHVGLDAVNVLNVPNSYNDTLDCAWLVVARDGVRVEMKLEGIFQLPCTDEFVVISNTVENSPSIGDYCKDRKQDNVIVTPFPYMLVQYHSEAKSNTSIRLSVKTLTGQCGGLLTDYDRVFETPGFPKGYQSNLECTWEIRANLGNRISLKFVERFAIEDAANCTKDVVILYDWKEEKYSEVSKLCGRNLPPMFNSTSNRMKVVLRTNTDITLDGFKAEWEPICGGTIIATTKEQYLYSPGYPDSYYPLSSCTYEIMSPTYKRKVQIKFLEFELEGEYPSCDYDRLTLSAPGSPSADVYYADYFEGVYCGVEKPPPLLEYTSVKLSFKSDGNIQRRGFKLVYSIYSCGGQVKEPTIIKSDGGGSYEHNLNCTWVIEAPENKIVVIEFKEFDLEGSSECYNDYVAIFNGPVIDEESRLALLCGSIPSPNTLRSNSNRMVVQMVTDSSVNYEGFEAEISFSYSSAVGCGGLINLTSSSTHTLKSPLIGGSVVYENLLDCYWSIEAPEDYTIKIEFTSFHVAPCAGVNQTAVGYSKCDCDYVEIKDGPNPSSTIIGTYCGHAIPPQLFSSGNYMSVRLSTDGELTSGGFEAKLTTQRSVCGQSWYHITEQAQKVKSPGYDSGSVPRGLRCVYHFDTSSEYYSSLHVVVKDLDIRPGDPEETQCNKDKLIFTRYPSHNNSSLGRDFIYHPDSSSLFSTYSSALYVDSMSSPNQLVYCGNKIPTDFYLDGMVTLILETSTESDSRVHKGFEIEVALTGICPNNHTGTQGRVRSYYDYNALTHGTDCYTLITAPENYTISIYFLSLNPLYYYDDVVLLEVFDGNATTAPKLATVRSEVEQSEYLFSNGRYVLFHNHYTDSEIITYDFNYVATDKGRGCGGKLSSVMGKISSPLYPETYRHKSTCEWELEAPYGSRLKLHFEIFDMGIACNQNYLQLVDRSGAVISSYCEEAPADYTSVDNYVKIVFTTTMNNGGTGWVAEFIALGDNDKSKVKTELIL